MPIPVWFRLSQWRPDKDSEEADVATPGAGTLNACVTHSSFPRYALAGPDAEEDSKSKSKTRTVDALAPATATGNGLTRIPSTSDCTTPEKGSASDTGPTPRYSTRSKARIAVQTTSPVARRTAPTQSTPAAASSASTATRGRRKRPASPTPTPTVVAPKYARKKARIKLEEEDDGAEAVHMAPAVAKTRSGAPRARPTARADTHAPPLLVEPSSASVELQLGGGNTSQRVFPPAIPIDPAFSGFYRRFPVSSDVGTVPNSKSNAPRSALDLYTPRFVRGIGRHKAGMCPICVEETARGGEGRKVWFEMKVSAYNYHMQYHHGISATTGRPFSPPVAFRTTPRPNVSTHFRHAVREGHCHACKRWIVLDTTKDVEAKVVESLWWKHAGRCHGAKERVEGNDGDFVEDEVHREVLSKITDAEE